MEKLKPPREGTDSRKVYDLVGEVGRFDIADRLGLPRKKVNLIFRGLYKRNNVSHPTPEERSSLARAAVREAGASALTSAERYAFLRFSEQESRVAQYLETGKEYDRDNADESTEERVRCLLGLSSLFLRNKIALSDWSTSRRGWDAFVAVLKGSPKDSDVRLAKRNTKKSVYALVEYAGRVLADPASKIVIKSRKEAGRHEWLILYWAMQGETATPIAQRTGFFVKDVQQVLDVAKAKNRLRRSTFQEKSALSSQYNRNRIFGLKEKMAMSERHSGLLAKCLPLILRGATIGEVQVITGLQRRSVKNAFTLAVHGGYPVPAFSAEEQTAREARNARFDGRKNKGLVFSETEEKNFAFLHELTERRKIPYDTKGWELLHQIYAKKGRPLPEQFAERLHLEIYLRTAYIAAYERDERSLGKYRDTVVSIDSVWAEAFLVEEKDFINSVLIANGEHANGKRGALFINAVAYLVFSDDQSPEDAAKTLNATVTEVERALALRPQSNNGGKKGWIVVADSDIAG